MQRSKAGAAGLLVGSALVLGVTACGPTAPRGASAPVGGRAAALDARPTSTAAPTTPTTTPSPTHSAQPVSEHVVTATDELDDQTFVVSLLSTSGSGHVSATVHDTAAGNARWTVSAAAGNAYWASGGALHRLDPTGTVTVIGGLPAAQFGRVVVSPDGTQWVYTTTATDANNVITNDVWRAGLGISTQQIVHRVDDPSHPTADAPAAWEYYLSAWTNRGVVAVRQPMGGCGCGQFDMQMSAQYSLFINPANGDSALITTQSDCPLSGAATSGIAACFHSNQAGGSDALQFIANGHSTSTAALSGANIGGDASFNPAGTTVAYATIDAAQAGCASAAPFTLRVMDVATRNATVVDAALSLDPHGWLNNGTVLATRTVPDAAGATVTSTVVVDPASGHLTTLASDGSRIVGVS